MTSWALQVRSTGKLLPGTVRDTAEQAWGAREMIWFDVAAGPLSWSYPQDRPKMRRLYRAVRVDVKPKR